MLPSDNGPTKRLKLEQLEHQSGAAIVEEITRGKIELEEEKKKAEQKIANLEAEKKELQIEKNELLKSLEIFKADHMKNKTEIVEMKEIISVYREFKNSKQ